MKFLVFYTFKIISRKKNHNVFHSILDGEMDAEGENFAGCDSIPTERFATPDVCGLPKERGEQGSDNRNYSTPWYFDMEYGGCAQ